MARKLTNEILRIIKSNKEAIALRDLIRQLEAKKYPLPAIIREIQRLEEEGFIILSEIRPRDPIRYLLSPMALSLWFVIVINLITLGLVLYGIKEMPYVILRYVLGSIFVLFIPGFSLIECLYFRREDLDDLERLALSIGLSLAIVPLVGLVLNYTPFGIRLIPISISLTLISLILISIAHVRRYRYFKSIGEVR